MSVSRTKGKRYLLGEQRRLKLKRVDYVNDLNPQQLEAVTAEEGPILVIAGAGSGKTRTVTYRVAWLIESGVAPERILLVTFTNKAAREMLHRVGLLVSGEARGIWGGTFHHIGNLVLRRYAHLLGYQNNYTIMDREDTKDLLEMCLGDLNINTREKKFPGGAVLSSIVSFSVNTQREIENVVEKKYPFFLELSKEIIRVVAQYKRRKERLNLMDYDDLLYNWKRLLLEFPAVRKLYSENFLHILVDEYQDTNKIQGEIIDLLAEYHHNIMVVGDDSQSIYSFRGANFVNIIDFPKRYPQVKLYKLEINYRSSPEILDLTNCIIAANERQFPKVLRPMRKSQSRPALVPLRDTSQQARFVVERILELIDEGKSLGEMAILYRSHYHSLEVQMELVRRGIPYRVRSGLRFFEKAHVKDVISYLKIMVNPRDELAWKRVLKILPGIGNVTADKIWKYISQVDDVFQVICSKEILFLFSHRTTSQWSKLVGDLFRLQSSEFTNNPAGLIEITLQGEYKSYLRRKYPDWEEREEDLKQLGNFARQYSSTRSFLSELALLGTVESETVILGEEEDKGVILSTIHQAKGLEWSVVFIIWLADGRFPAARALISLDSVEEERRLLYVAATRAKDELYLCYPIIGGSWKQATIMKPSRFIRELDKDTYEEWIVDEEVDRLLKEIEKGEFYLD